MPGFSDFPAWFLRLSCLVSVVIYKKTLSEPKGEFLSLNMAETACPLAQATGEGLADMAELAIAQVQTEFFK